MAFFARIGARWVNVEAIAVAERASGELKVVFGTTGAIEYVITFEGGDADRVENEILKYQEIIDTSLRRRKVLKT